MTGIPDEQRGERLVLLHTSAQVQAERIVANPVDDRAATALGAETGGHSLMWMRFRC